MSEQKERAELLAALHAAGAASEEDERELAELVQADPSLEHVVKEFEDSIAALASSFEPLETSPKTLGKIKKQIDAGQARVTVVDEKGEHVYQPGLLFVPFGLAHRDEIIDAAAHRGVRTLQVAALEPQGHVVDAGVGHHRPPRGTSRGNAHDPAQQIGEGNTWRKGGIVDQHLQYGAAEFSGDDLP